MKSAILSKFGIEADVPVGVVKIGANFLSIGSSVITLPCSGYDLLWDKVPQAMLEAISTQVTAAYYVYLLDAQVVGKVDSGPVLTAEDMTAALESYFEDKDSLTLCSIIRKASLKLALKDPSSPLAKASFLDTSYYPQESSSVFLATALYQRVPGTGHTYKVAAISASVVAAVKIHGLNMSIRVVTKACCEFTPEQLSFLESFGFTANEGYQSIHLALHSTQYGDGIIAKTLGAFLLGFPGEWLTPIPNIDLLLSNKVKNEI
jgi:hypothetical protein